MLSVRNASFHAGTSFLDGVADATDPVLGDICFDLSRGEALGVLGPRGAGKSVLAQLLCGFLPLHGGQVSGGPATSVCEDPTVHEDLTVGETIEMWQRAASAPAATGCSVEEVIGLADLHPWRNRAVRDCFEHVRCATAIAVALLGHPPVLILDEPFRRADPRHRPQLLALLGRLRDAGTSLVYATRSAEDVATLCDRQLSLADGHLLPAPHQKAG